MSTPFIKRPAVQTPALYGHPEDETFETESASHAAAYALVYPLRGWVRARLERSGRFKQAGHLEGAYKRHIELLTSYEELKLAAASEQPSNVSDIGSVIASQLS